LDLCNYTLPVVETNAEAYEFIDSLVYMGAPRRLLNWGGHPENLPTNSRSRILLIVTEYSGWGNSCAGFEVHLCFCRYLARFDYSILKTEVMFLRNVD
jgi:hypothetical protein